MPDGSACGHGQVCGAHNWSSKFAYQPPDFHRLAALGPVKLRDLFDADRTRRDYDQSGRKYSERKPPAGALGDGSLEADIYMANFSQLERVSWNELYRCLWD